MRVLLKDKENCSYIAIEIKEIGYSDDLLGFSENPEKEKLEGIWMCNYEGEIIIIPGINKNDCNHFIYNIIVNTIMDFTNYELQYI